MRILVRMAKVAGYTTVPNWRATATTHIKALLHGTTYAVCSLVLLTLGILYVFSCDEICLVMLADLVHGEF